MLRFFHYCVVALISIGISMPTLAAANEPSTIASSADFRLDVRTGAGSIARDGDTITAVSERPQAEAWALQIQIPPLRSPVAKNEAFCLVFDARCVTGETDGEGDLRVTMAKNDPFEVMQNEDGFRALTIPQDWHRFQVCFRASRGFAANEIYASFQFASKRQRIEIRTLRLLGFGQTPDEKLPVAKLYYAGARDRSWQREAERRIARYRQADLKVRVVNAQGQPAANVKVNVQQQKHAYAFGTFVGDTPLGGDRDSERFRRQTQAWFNRVTLPRYWADWGTDTERGRQRADAVAAWAAKSGFQLKTHLLLYPLFIPERVKKLAGDPLAFQTAIESAMDNALLRTRNLDCVAWDAINELRDVSLVGDVLGTGYYADVFNRGNRAHPEATWFINEYGILTGGTERDGFLQTYIDQIEQIRRDGGTLEGIGVQGHFQGSLVSVRETWAILDRLAEFKLPIEITEFDVDTRDEETQAQFTRDFMTSVFAHPATSGLTTWGFWEGDMWRPAGAMFRKDWSKKPNGEVWEDLVFNRWWTDQTATTNAQGEATIRVFKGTHRVGANDVFSEVLVADDAELSIQIE